jgi:hypothetical protein
MANRVQNANRLFDDFWPNAITGEDSDLKEHGAVTLSQIVNARMFEVKRADQTPHK